MNIERRGFLKLIGLGGGGIVLSSAIPAVAKPIIAPLFGSDELRTKPLIIGTSTDLGVHRVLYARPVVKAIPREQQNGMAAAYRNTPAKYHPAFGAGEPGEFDPCKARVVGKIRSQLPQKRRLQDAGFGLVGGSDRQTTWVSEWEDVQEFRIVPPGMPDAIEGVDPHALYYQAAMAMRERFRQHTINRLTELHEGLRKGVNLVTIVHQPIYARPLDMKVGFPWPRVPGRVPWPEEGFEVACEFQTLLYRSHQPADLDGFEEYSAMGEYPIDVPSNIEMGILMKLDREVLSSGVLADPRAATRRGFFSSWRS